MFVPPLKLGVVYFVFFFVKPENLVGNLYVRKNHSATAISGYS